MTVLRRIANTVVGLFVDDGALAGLALVWVAVCWGVLPLLLGPGAVALLLVLGLAAALGASVGRG